MITENIERSISEPPESVLTSAKLQRYARHLSIKEVGVPGQRRLKAARVLVVGAGGLGSPALMYLAAAGVGTLRVVDDDVVDRPDPPPVRGCGPGSFAGQLHCRPAQGRRARLGERRRPSSVATETTTLRRGRGSNQRLKRESPDGRNQLRRQTNKHNGLIADRDAVCDRRPQRGRRSFWNCRTGSQWTHRGIS